MASGSGLGRRILAIGFIVAAFAAAIAIYYKWAKPELGLEGSSESDEIWLLCTKCDGESRVTSARLGGIYSANTGAYVCPKCGEAQARIAPTRCGKCGRLILPQPPGSPLVCPHCKRPLGALKSGSAPGQTDTEQQKAPDPGKH